MLASTIPIVTDLVREAAHPLTGSSTDYDSLFELIGDARFVLLGEASHGTHEFYRERARITQRLIRDKGFNAMLRKRTGQMPIVSIDMCRGIIRILMRSKP